MNLDIGTTFFAICLVAWRFFIFRVGHEYTFFCAGFQLFAKMKIPKYSDVFLVDHAWSHDGGAMALQQLKNMPQLVSRMQNLFGIVKFNDELTSANDEVFGCENAVCKICNCSIECAR